MDVRASKIIELMIIKSSHMFCIFNIKSECYMKNITKISIKMYTSDTFSVRVDYHFNKIAFQVLDRQEVTILISNIFKHDIYIDDIDNFLSDYI